MPSSAQKSRGRVKKWKKESPESYKENRKRYRRQQAKAGYERVKTWRQGNPEKHLLQKTTREMDKTDTMTSHKS